MKHFVKPKKFLGQHFLKDETIAEKITNALPKDLHSFHVNEIGPGMGVLTKYISIIPGIDFSVCELDRESVAYLKTNFPSLRIIEGDFLHLDLVKEFNSKPLIIIGNYPYNISSQIIFKVIENRNQVEVCIGMFQKEVAERIAAKEGSKVYGILSVITQLFYDVEYLFTVEPGVFIPPPKVRSGVIRIIKKKNVVIDCDIPLLFKVIKTGFNQRRKTLRNALRSLVNTQLMLPGIYLDKRAEQLSVADFIKLTQQVASVLNISDDDNKK